MALTHKRQKKKLNAAVNHFLEKKPTLYMLFSDRFSA